MLAGEILYAVDQRIATITFNRPERLNAWTGVMESEFRARLAQAEQDPEVIAIIVTGAGKGFCAGADLSPDSATGLSDPAPPSQDDFGQRYSHLLAIQKPLIAAINGAIAGVGLVIALFCDIRYMAAGAKLTTAFTRRGLVAEHASSWLLPRLVGPMNALDLLMSGRVITTEQAQAMGLVRMLPEQKFMDLVREEVAHFLSASPRAMAVVKRQIYEGMRESLAEASIKSQHLLREAATSSDCAEGIASFREKRPSQFAPFTPFPRN